MSFPCVQTFPHPKCIPWVFGKPHHFRMVLRQNMKNAEFLSLQAHVTHYTCTNTHTHTHTHLHTHKDPQLTLTLCLVPSCHIIMITGAFMALHKNWLTSSVVTILTALSLSNSRKTPRPQFLSYTCKHHWTHTHTHTQRPFKCSGAVSNLEVVWQTAF